MTEQNQTQEQEIKIRSLHAGDVLTLAKILARIGMDAKDAIKDINDSHEPKIKAAHRILIEAEAQTYENDEERTKALETAEKQKQAELGRLAGERGQEIAFSVLILALEKAEIHLKGFFADLVGKKADEFNNLGFSAPIDIIDQLAASPDFNDFFQKAQNLAKRFMK